MLRWSARIAAAVIVAVSCGFLINEYQYDKLAQLQTVTVPAGQRAQITLADGTKVWLNSESTLSYRSDFGRRDRDVELDGEAYFEVAKNKEIPFYVNTETNQVRVVGTHFNVCAYKGSNEFETTLVEGIVDIYAYDNERPLTRLTKNEFFGSYQGKYKKAVLPSYDYLRWREGLYCFDDSPFSCILTKLEKYYNVKITVENPKVLNYRCTGKFKEQDRRFLLQTGSYNSNAYSLKYDIKLGQDGSDMVPGIRLSEMYYIMGEYFARKGEYSQAGKMLDEVRYARGILTTNMENSIGSLEGFHTELLKDMRKEFVGEGQMFFQYKRMDKKPVDNAIFVFDKPDNEDV